MGRFLINSVFVKLLALTLAVPLLVGCSKVMQEIIGAKAPAAREPDSESVEPDDTALAAPTSMSLQTPLSSPSNVLAPTVRVNGVSPGATVAVFSDASCSTLLVSGTAATTAVDLTLPAQTVGSHSYYSRQTLDGEVSDCSASLLSYVVDTSAAAPTTISLAAPSNFIGTLATPTFSVSAVEIGATVSLYSDAGCTTQVASTTASSTTATLQPTLATRQRYVVYAKQVDPAGNTSACSTASAVYYYAKLFSVTSTTSAMSLDTNVGDGLCINIDGKCSLRAAFAEAAATPTVPHVFTLEAGTYSVTSGLAANYDVVRLVGASPATTVIDGVNNSDVFVSNSDTTPDVISLENLELKRFTTTMLWGDILTNGVGTGAKYYLKSIYIRDNTVSNFDSVIMGRNTNTYLEDVLFENNTGCSFYQWSGTANLKNVFFKNSSSASDAIEIRAANAVLESVTVTGASTGLYLNKSVEVEIKNSTFTANTTQAVNFFHTAPTGGEWLKIYNSTFSNNGAASNGTFRFAFTGAPTPSILSYNSIFAINSAKANCLVTSLAPSALTFQNSLLDEGSCGAGTNTVSAAPLLNALAGTTYVQTMIPQAGSPALDAGQNSSCLATDQRGYTRPVAKVGATALCDIGAVELQANE